MLIESTGISEPLPVAETFTFEDEAGVGLSELARLDTMVTVVDAKNFLSDWQSEDELRQRQLALSEEDERNVADLLVEQIEFADVLVVSKLDLVTAADAERLFAMLKQLNPVAKLVRAEHGRVDPAEILGTGLFDFDRASSAPGWLLELRGEHVPESVEYGIASFVYRARRPFHPTRFWSLLQDGEAWEGVLRSKGFFWLATRMDETGMWSQAGGSASCEGAGQWYASLPEEEWPQDAETREQLQRDFQAPWGDRRQELVFIGANLNETLLRSKLDSALLTEAEFKKGPLAWRRLKDPFPSWDEDGEASGDASGAACRPTLIG